jgi:cell division protein FtsL
MASLLTLTVSNVLVITLIAIAIVVCVLFFVFAEMIRLSHELDDLKARVLDTELHLSKTKKW